MHVEDSTTYPEVPPVESAEWRLSVSEHDPYELSVAGSLSVVGESGQLIVRARYRKDADRLEDCIVREEKGFWTGEDDPDRGDVPFETEVSTWTTEASDATGFLSVCESSLVAEVEHLYDEYARG